LLDFEFVVVEQRQQRRLQPVQDGVRVDRVVELHVLLAGVHVELAVQRFQLISEAVA
jgi:hypothetical protein